MFPPRSGSRCRSAAGLGACIGLAAALAVSASCGRNAALEPVCLARADQAAVALGAARPLGEPPGGGPATWIRPAEDGRGWWVEWELTAERWAPGPIPGVLLARRCLPPRGRPPADGPAEYLLLDGDALPRVDMDAVELDPLSLPEHAWLGVGDSLMLRVGPTGPPPLVRAGVFIDRGYERRGGWHVRSDLRAGLGWTLPSGASASWTVDLPPEPVLHFALEAFGHPLGASDPEAPADPGARDPLEFELLLDGEPLWRASEATSVAPELLRHALSLGGGARRGARLELRTSGPAALWTLFAPRIVSARVERRRDPRPDLIVFVADTLRADALGVYAGRPTERELRAMPFLDRLAQEALVFERAWSPSPWTLPSHATLLTGLLPVQHGATSLHQRLPSPTTTLADQLTAAGYRTEAATDGAYVSATFGLHLGFELFDEHHGELERTLARTLSAVDACDGRPLFLLVQSYEVHTPYLPSPQARAFVGASEEDEFQIFDRLVQASMRADALGQDASEDPEVKAIMRSMERLYLAGAHDLDRGFERLWTELEGRGWPERGVLVFTSDHGEAFGEHRALFHGHHLFDEELRIPMLLRGPGIPTGVDGRPAGLADLAATLARLGGARLEHPGPGQDLLATAVARPIWLDKSPMMGSPGARGAVDGGLKLLWPLDRPPEAFDLVRDPAEQHRLEPDPARSAALQRAYEHWPSRFRTTAEASAPTAADQARLRALGYVGD